MSDPSLMRTRPALVLLPLVAWLAVAATTPAFATDETVPAAPAAADHESVPAATEEDDADRASAARLAQEFSDPLTTLPQVFVKDAYAPANYGIPSYTNRLVGRIIVPRLPRFSLFPFVQLVRPSFSLVTVPDGRGGPRTAFGDMQLFDLAILPWPGKESGLLMGIGPLFVFPTASDRLAGQGAWQVGPAFGMVYKGLPEWLFGCLVQDPVSFAYTSRGRRPVGLLTVQPIVLRHLWRGLYAKTGDATWAVDWRNGSSTTVPLSFGLGWVLVRPGQPPINLFVSGEWMAYRHDAPAAAQTTVNFGITVAFPEWRPWL